MGYDFAVNFVGKCAEGSIWYWYARVGEAVPANGRGSSGTPKSACVGCHAVLGGYTVADVSGADRFGPYTVSAGVLNVGDRGTQRDVSADFNEEGRRLFLSLLARF